MITTNAPSVEHFCTLFDSNYLPLGMALHQSLMTHAQTFHLWILCMDELVEQQLKQLCLPQVSLIPLKQLETPELLAVKPERSRAEYCWTLTPFTFQAVFDRNINVERVTYLDADLFFLADPRILLQEFSEHEHVLITDHAYAPEYDQSAISGRFCVQFLTFRRTWPASTIMKWWQDRCLEWCFNRAEDGKFGDQKYLDAWIDLFSNDIHIVRQTEKTLAPWNINWLETKFQGKLEPVFYHFHGLKFVRPDRIQLYSKYRIGGQGLKLYQIYLNELSSSIRRIQSIGTPIPYFPLSNAPMAVLRRLKQLLNQETKFSAISYNP